MDYHFNYTFIWRHFDRLFNGLVLSIELTLVSIVIGIGVGLLLALIYTGGGRIQRTLVAVYVECIRNVPLLLLVYLVFYGIPSIGGIAYPASTSFVVTLSVYAAAYMVEIFRSGLEAIPAGLIDAGKTIGLTPLQRLVSIRIPTMFRIVLPALSNAFVSLFKDTAIASAISVPELMFGAQWINLNSFRVIEVYSVITPMYLLTGYGILLALRRFERRFAIYR